MKPLGSPLGDLGMWLSKTKVNGAKDSATQIIALMDEVNALFKANPTMWIDGLEITGGLTSAQVGVMFHDGAPYPHSVLMGGAYLWLSKVNTYEAIKGADEPMTLLEEEVATFFRQHPDAKLATWRVTGGRGSLLVSILSYVELPECVPE